MNFSRLILLLKLMRLRVDRLLQFLNFNKILQMIIIPKLQKKTKSFLINYRRNYFQLTW